jgi:hypothetical protein
LGSILPFLDFGHLQLDRSNLVVKAVKVGCKRDEFRFYVEIVVSANHPYADSEASQKIPNTFGHIHSRQRDLWHSNQFKEFWCSIDLQQFVRFLVIKLTHAGRNVSNAEQILEPVGIYLNRKSEHICMVEYLEDLQSRNIHTKPDLGLNGAFFLGDRVFELLRNLMHEDKITGAYFSHYFEQSNPPHVKVGIRYGNLRDLDSVSSMLDKLCDEQKDLVVDKGKFQTTTGECKDPPLPADIIVDYIACHSFEFLLRARNEVGKMLPPHDAMAQFFLRHKGEIERRVIYTPDIFRDSQHARHLTNEETRCVWERFVHHLLNANKVTYNPLNPTESYEPKVKRLLLEHGIDIA